MIDVPLFTHKTTTRNLIEKKIVTSISKTRGWVVLLLAGVVWGVTFTLAKIVTEAGAHPLGMNLWQAVVGSIVLGLILLLKKVSLPVDREHIRFYLVCSLTGTILPGTLLFFCASKLPAGVLAITTAIVPIFTVIAAVFFRIEIFQFRRALGVLLGALSIVLMAAPETSLPDPGSRIWILLAVLASMLYCAENIFITLKKPADTDAITILCGMQILAAAIMLPVVLMTDTGVPLNWLTEWQGGILIAMALINMFAYASFIYLISWTGPVFASQMAYIITLAGVFWGMFDSI